MKSTWFLVVSCIAAGAIAIGCGDSEGGGSGGTGGTGATGWHVNTCTEDSVPGAFLVACEMEGSLCMEYRGTSLLTVSQIEEICLGIGMDVRNTPCAKGDDYLGTCLENCGEPGETAVVQYSVGGLLEEEDVKDSCRNGTWVK